MDSNMEDLVVFLFCTIMFCHIMACMWVFLSSFAEKEDNTFHDKDFIAMSVSARYIHSLYFIITTLSTVGYGDLSASNEIEKLICIGCMLIGVSAFAYVTSTMTTLIQNYDSDNE